MTLVLIGISALLLEGLTFKNRGHWGSRCIFIFIYIYKYILLNIIYDITPWEANLEFLEAAQVGNVVSLGMFSSKISYRTYPSETPDRPETPGNNSNSLSIHCGFTIISQDWNLSSMVAYTHSASGESIVNIGSWAESSCYPLQIWDIQNICQVFSIFPRWVFLLRIIDSLDQPKVSKYTAKYAAPNTPVHLVWEVHHPSSSIIIHLAKL